VTDLQESVDGILEAAPRKRGRPRNQTIRDDIYEIIAADHPMTVRQVFYQMVSRHALPKTEGRYEAVGRILKEMRLEGRVPFGWVADNTRWQRKPRSFSGPEAALQHWARAYRRDLWDSSDV
jgi:hypothetical protein